MWTKNANKKPKKPENSPNELILKFWKKSSNTPPVVWVEESKNGLGFEIGLSYANVPATSECVTDG